MTMIPSEINILIVEDNEDHALLAQLALRGAGFEGVSVVNSADECRQLLASKSFHIILLDYNLPHEDGLSLLRKLEAKVEAPIIFVTGCGHEKVAVEAMKAGAFDYVMKSEDYPGILPNTVKRVLQRFEIHLEKKKMEAELVLRNKELQVFNNVSQVLNNSLILDEILAGTVKMLAKSFELDTAAVFMKNTDRNSLIRITGTGILKRSKRMRILPLDAVFEGKSIPDSVCAFEPGVSMPGVLGDCLYRADLHSALIAPLIHKDQLSGIFVGARKVEGFFAERRINLFESISHQIAIAIENANLYKGADSLNNDLKNVLNSSLDQIVSLDSSGHIRFFNEQFKRAHKKDKIHGTSFLDFVPEQKHDYILRRILAKNPDKSSIYEAEILQDSGKIMQCLISQSKLKGKDELLLVIKDLSQILSLHNQLMQSEKLSALGQMIAGAAHELNNPLAGILGYGQLILEEEIPESIRSDVKVIVREAKRCQRIVKNLLTFTRTKRRAQESVDLNEVVNSVIEPQKYQLKVQSIQIEKVLSTELPQLSGDFSQLQQVVLSLFKNAHDALLESDKPTKTMRIQTQLNRRHIWLIVEDNGIGMKPSLRNRIFEPFFTTKEVGKGTGLGLSMCYGIVEAHQGELEVESEFGVGSKFVVKLPTQCEYDGVKAKEIMLGRYASMRV